MGFNALRFRAGLGLLKNQSGLAQRALNRRRSMPSIS